MNPRFVRRWTRNPLRRRPYLVLLGANNEVMFRTQTYKSKNVQRAADDIRAAVAAALPSVLDG